MQIIAEFDPSAAASGTFPVNYLSNGMGKIIVWNESNWTLDITFTNGNEDIAPAWTAQIFELTGPAGQITWAQDTQLTSLAPPISKVWVVAYRDNENIPGVFPVALVRQANIGNVINTVGGVANSVQNDGNAVGTSVVEATVLGDGASAVSLTNAGHLTLGTVTNNGLFHFVGSAGNVDIASTGIMSVDNKINFNLAVAETGNDFTVNVASGHKIALQNNGSDAVDINGSGLQLENGFKFLSQSGHTLQDWNAGIQSGVNSGGVTITHGLKSNGVATAPTAIFALMNNGGTSEVVSGANANSTTFQLFTNAATGRNVWWIAILL